jgi:hypothetical protein
METKKKLWAISFLKIAINVIGVPVNWIIKNSKIWNIRVTTSGNHRVTTDGKIRVIKE